MTKKFIKTFFFILLIAVLSGTVFFTFSAVYENNQIEKLVSEFISDGERLGFSKTYNAWFYKVKKDYKDITPSFTYVEEKDRPYFFKDYPYVCGSTGDILTSLHSPLDSKILRDFVEFYFGGHAAIVNGYNVIETTGLNEDMSTNVVIRGDNDWLYPYNTKRAEFIALKVKNASETDRIKAYENAESKLGEPYNYSFIFNTKKSHYCTDLVSKSYYQVSEEYDLNEDEIAVTVQDLIVSSNTYIFLYKNQNLDGTYNIYYLDDGIEYDFNLEVNKQ